MPTSCGKVTVPVSVATPLQDRAVHRVAALEDDRLGHSHPNVGVDVVVAALERTEQVAPGHDARRLLVDFSPTGSSSLPVTVGDVRLFAASWRAREGLPAAGAAEALASVVGDWYADVAERFPAFD